MHVVMDFLQLIISVTKLTWGAFIPCTVFLRDYSIFIGRHFKMGLT